MEFLSLIASLTQRATVVSEQILDKELVPPFALGDVLDGKIAVVSETSDPTQPTEDVPLDSSGGVALTDGAGIVYAAATNVTIQNINEITFTLVVDSVALQQALALSSEDAIPVFLEARGTIGAQDTLILREPTIITKTATGL